MNERSVDARTGLISSHPVSEKPMDTWQSTGYGAMRAYIICCIKLYLTQRNILCSAPAGSTGTQRRADFSKKPADRVQQHVFSINRALSFTELLRLARMGFQPIPLEVVYLEG